MTCDECQDLLPLYVTGALEPGEEAAVRAHLAKGCPACAAALAAAEATLHQLPLALPQTAPPAAAWQKLESQISAGNVREELRAERDSDRAVLASPFSPPPKKSNTWLGWAVAAAVFVVMNVWLLRVSDSADKARLAATSAASILKAQVSRMESQLTELQAQLAASQTKPAEFAVAAGDQKDVKGKMRWDKVANTLTIDAQGVKPLEGGKVYELWIVTSAGSKLAAGTATPDATGKLTHTTNLPAGTIIAAAAFTDEDRAEPDNGAKGQIQFLASLVRAQ